MYFSERNKLASQAKSTRGPFFPMRSFSHKQCLVFRSINEDPSLDSRLLSWRLAARSQLQEKGLDESLWMAYFKGSGEKEPLLHCCWECKLIQSLWRTVWRFLKKLNIELPYDSAISLCGMYPETIIIQKRTCIPVFIAALVIVAKTSRKMIQTTFSAKQSRDTETEDKCMNTEEGKVGGGWVGRLGVLYVQYYV